MSLTDFLSLDNKQRYFLWLSLSVQVASYETMLFKYVLYQLEAFYIEMRVLKSKPGECLVYVLRNEAHLDTYLAKIDLGELSI